MERTNIERQRVRLWQIDRTIERGRDFRHL